MTALLRRLARSGFGLYGPFHKKTPYIRPQQGDSRQDFNRIATDMDQVSKDFRRTAARELDRVR